MANDPLLVTQIPMRQDELQSDRVLVGTAMCGAVCGAVAGVLTTPLLGGSIGSAELFGVLGTMIGSLTGAFLGHFVLLPVRAVRHAVHPEPHVGHPASGQEHVEPAVRTGLALDA